MTEKETREWLSSIKIYTDEVNNLLEQIEQLRAIAESCTVNTEKESVQSSSGDKLANIVGKMVDLENKLMDIDHKVLAKRQMFGVVTNQMGDNRQTQFLTIRYLDGHSFYDTVMLMDLTDSTARRIEKRGISEFADTYNTIFSGKSH